eukprot:15462807-Alexandrium_andersonii.AAC.1
MSRREDAGGEAVLRQLVPISLDSLPAMRFREDGEVRALGQEVGDAVHVVLHLLGVVPEKSVGVPDHALEIPSELPPTVLRNNKPEPARIE